MPYDRLINRLLRVDQVRRDLMTFLARLGVALRAGVASLRRGVPLSAQTREATQMHVELVQKLDEMHHAVHEARAEGVRVLVDEEGLPVSTVARLMGRPRQLVSRLYQQGRASRRPGHDGRAQATPNGSRRLATNGRVKGEGRSGASSRTTIPPAAE